MGGDGGVSRRGLLIGTTASMLAAGGLLSAVAEDLGSFTVYADRRPLACWRGWGDPALDGVDLPHGARASQRRFLQELQRHKVFVGFGGNRGGKTEVLRAALVALALGSDHPDARIFWLAHGCDPDAFPPGPSRVWSITRTSSDSIRYNRKQILGLVPKWGPRHPKGDGGASFQVWNLDGRGESHIEVMCPGYAQPAEVWFKSEDQEEDSFDGDAIRAAHHDEEGKTAKVWDQVHYRTTDMDGWQFLSDAPIKGRTWVFDRFEQRGQANARMLRLWSIDNPYLPRNRALELDRDPVRGRGQFMTAKGRIWPMFSRDTHVLPHWVPPPDAGPRFRAIDFGTRHPHAVIWGVLLRRAMQIGAKRVPDGSLVIYRQHYQARWTLAQHVDRYRELEGWVRGPDGRWRRGPGTETIEASWADPEDPQQLLSLNSDHDIEVMKANKHVEAGLDAVAEWLTPDRVTGAPRLWVTEDCPDVIREWEDYVEVEDVDREGVPTHRPSGRSDHTCDCGRYLVVGVRAYVG